MLEVTATIQVSTSKTTDPVIAGTAVVLAQATFTTPAAFTNIVPGSARYQWLRNGVAIIGETAAVYYFATLDVGASITCRVTVTKITGGTTSATSNAVTGIVEATTTVLKSPIESAGPSSDAPTQALIGSNGRWKSSGGTRVITYSFPSSIDCYGDLSFDKYFDDGQSPPGLRAYPGQNPWTYNFVLTSGVPVPGDKYTHNGNTFRVTAFSSSTMTAWSESTTPAPLSSGTLTRSSGTGSASLTFSSQVGFSQATATEQANVRRILAMLENIADLHFVEVVENSGTDPAAVLRFVNVSIFFGTLSAATGATPGQSGGNVPSGGDVWLNKPQFNTTMSPGSFLQMAVIHEIGHTMGFRHPQDASPALTSSLNWIPYTIMTDRSSQGGSSYANANGTYPNTFMGVDVKALKYLYGANPRWKPAGVTYKFLPTGEWFIDGVSQGTPAGSKLLMTVIESSNGNDTYDFSAFNPGEVTANVGDGTWMDLPGLVPDMASGSTHRAPGSVFFEYGLNPANKTVILP